MNVEDKEEENREVEPIDITGVLNDFFMVFRKHLFGMLFLILAGASIFTFYKNITYVSFYTASATCAITTTEDSSAGGAYYNNSAAEQLCETFPYILTSDILQSRVALALDMDHVPGTIQADVVDLTNFVTISVTDTNGGRAYNTLQAVLETYPQISEPIIGKIYTEMMDETGIPDTPDNPNSMKRNLATGGILGFLVSLVWMLLLLLTNRTVHTEDDCIKRINTKCLGTIPFVRHKIRSKDTEFYPNIMAKNVDEDFAESLRIIRNKIEHRAKKKRIKTIIVTSALPREGKSTIAVNIALALMQAEKKVVLIDADLRNPSDLPILNAPKGDGLIDFLKGKVEFKNCVVHGSELYDYKYPLLFLRGGKPVQDGSKYLASERMKKLINLLKTDMDYVIIDSAPAGLMTDAGILAQYADAAVFVVKRDYVKADKILEAMEHMTDNNVEIMGCILNGAD